MDHTKSNSSTDEGFLAQVNRILHSDTLRSSDVLRRLLVFLSEKYISGEADQLKEYTIAVDALEKPMDYDPQHDSTVRMHMARLRQKLAEYYRTEGKEDSTIIDLPRGRFKLALVRRPLIEQTVAPSRPTATSSKPLLWGLAFAVVLVASTLSAYQVAKEGNDRKSGWNKELAALWNPFFTAGRPLVIALGDPPFVMFPGGLVCRDTSVDRSGELENSSSFGMLRKVLNNPGTQSHYYTAFGEIGASFLLGRLLGTQSTNASFIRISQLSQAQLAENNMVLVGKDEEFRRELDGMPLKTELLVTPHGIQNIHPYAGEPTEFLNETTQEPEGNSGQDGQAYALVSHLAGPRRNTDILVFTSKNTFGYLGAVQAFTDPAFARTVTAELRKANGEVPRYYQLLLKVRFRDQVPTETTLVLSRVLG